MKRVPLSGLMSFALFVGSSTVIAQEVEDKSFVTESGERILRLEIIVDCSLEDAWELFATAEGLSTWMAPVIQVEMRNGGRWEASYDKTKKIGDSGNIINEVLCVVPLEMYVMRVAQVPDNFPFDPELVYQARSIVQFESVGEDRVKLTFTGTGYGEGSDWDRIYRVSVSANCYTLKEFGKRVKNGPVNWDE